MRFLTLALRRSYVSCKNIGGIWICDFWEDCLRAMNNIIIIIITCKLFCYIVCFSLLVKIILIKWSCQKINFGHSPNSIYFETSSQ
jgi:hypothetical protein